MSDEERKALVGRLRSNRPLPTLPHEAADQIEADGQRIAELERDLNRCRMAMAVMDNTNATLEAALREMFEVVCGETGFAQAVRAESGIPYPWPALDIAEAKTRAALGERS